MMPVALSILATFLITPQQPFLTIGLWLLIYGSSLNILAHGEDTLKYLEYIFMISGGFFFLIALLKLMKENKHYSLLANVLDKINDAVLVWDKHGKLLSMNKAASNLTGYSIDELKDKKFDIIVSADEIKDAEEKFRLINTESVEYLPIYERKFVNREGRTIFVEESVSVIRDEKSNILYIIETARDISDRKRLEELLTKERERFYKYFDLAQVIMVILNPEGKIELINQKGCEILGYSKIELIGRDWFDFIPEHQKEDVKKVFESIINGKLKPFENFENFIVNARGEYKLISWRNTYLKDENGNITSVLSSGVDITEARKKHIYTQKMKEVYELLFDITTLVLEAGWSEEYYQSLLERLMEIIPEAQAGSCLIRKNGDFKFIAAVGYDIEELQKVSIPEDIVRIYSEEVGIIKGQLIYDLNKERNLEKLDVIFREMNGKTLMSVLVIPLYLGNYLMGAMYLDNFENENAFNEELEIASIISRYLQLILWKQKTDERLRHFATHDSLTNALNRAAFMEMAEKVMSLSKRNNRKFAIVYIDLDDFKKINDTHGHEFGDEFLNEFSKKIMSIIRESDLFARFGGDEFVLLLPETDENGAQVFIKRLREILEDEFEFRGKKIKYKFSAGIAVFPDDDGNDLEKFINIADERMYSDKRKRKGGKESYDH
ncbi:MAG: hypothetical protein PWQ48_1111 [Thermotogaceae bacterium]|nr:hypothetical protein [Thermotogaceae bacterium]